MKVFSAGQLRQADAITIERQKISSTALMERAGKEVFNWLRSRFEAPEQCFHIFCGMGNNGGDGLVIARYLLQHHYKVQLYHVCFSSRSSADFDVNSDKLKALNVMPHTITSVEDFPEIQKEDIVIDAIFGIGLSRPPSDWIAALIRHINHAEATTIAVDIPSGLYMHTIPEDPTTVIKADFTLTFEAPKLVFFLPQTAPYTGKWEALDIGLDRDYLNEAVAEAHITEKATLLKWYRRRKRFSHKGTYGHALIIAGSYGKMGAAVLTAKACINSGAGLVTAYSPKCGYAILQTAIPEVMVITDKSETCISHIDLKLKPTIIGIGPGLVQLMKLKALLSNL